MIDVDGLPELWSSWPVSAVLAGVAGIVSWHLIPERLATTRLVTQIFFFGAMSALFWAGAIVPYEVTTGESAATVIAGAAKALWWLHLAWALIGIVRLYLVIERRPREARLLQDIIVGIVYLGMVLSVLAFVLGAPVGTLLATSGVLAIVLGLALQNTLGDLFSGVALNLGRPYAIGDWIGLDDGTEGRVVETNWQSIHLLTSTQNLMALPNSMLARRAITNFSRPDATHVLLLTVRFVPTVSPKTVADAMGTALSNADSVLRDPPPSVAITGIDATAIELELTFRVRNIADSIPARNSVIDLVFRHAWAEALMFATPVSGSIVVRQAPEDNLTAQVQSNVRVLLDLMPAFRSLGNDDRAKLAATASARRYIKEEIIVNRGEKVASLMMVASGVICRIDRDEDKAVVTGHLGPGDIFGRTGMNGERDTLQAQTHVTAYEISQEDLEVVLQLHPEWGADLSGVLDLRSPGRENQNNIYNGVHPPSVRLLEAALGVFRHGPLKSN